MSDLVKAAILGVVQGITEFLPVSSTAHLLIGGRLLRYEDPGGVFTVMIQLGSIFAVMWLYREKIYEVISGLPTRPEARRFALVIVVATIPALVAGALLSKFIQGVLYESLSTIAVAFIAGGVVMMIVERNLTRADVRSVDEVPLGRAFGVGVAQTFALIPGVSRSGATIVGGMVERLDRPTAAEFSFFLAMPTMAAAFAKSLFDVRHNLGAARAEEIAVGFVMAFASSAAIVRPFLGYVRRAGFAPFAWYRVALGIALLAAVAAGWS